MFACKSFFFPQARPASSVDPGMFVFCPEGSPPHRCYDLFHCKRKYSFFVAYVSGIEQDSTPLLK